MHSALQVKPTVLIGLAGAGKLFVEEILQTMGQHNERPIIMYVHLASSAPFLRHAWPQNNSENIGHQLSSPS